MAKDPIPAENTYQKAICHSELDSESKTVVEVIIQNLGNKKRTLTEL